MFRYAVKSLTHCGLRKTVVCVVVMHQTTAFVCPDTETCYKGLFRVLWEGTSRNKMGMRLKYKSAKVHVFMSVSAGCSIHSEGWYSSWQYYGSAESSYPPPPPFLRSTASNLALLKRAGHRPHSNCIPMEKGMLPKTKRRGEKQEKIPFRRQCSGMIQQDKSMRTLVSPGNGT